MSSNGERTVAGVDGAKGEWVVCFFDGQTLVWETTATVEGVLELTAHCRAVGIDMPLSMPVNGYRTSELEAKAFLGPARSSIFHTPVVDVLDAADYVEACDISRRVTGKAVSKQTWYILPAVRAWRDASFDPDRYVEVHPECSFRTMKPNASYASKKTGRGVGQRLSALTDWLPGISLSDLPTGPAIDDILDAAAAAWSAHRFGRGEHRTFGTADASDRIVA